MHENTLKICPKRSLNHSNYDNFWKGAKCQKTTCPEPQPLDTWGHPGAPGGGP
jgi:hypothetical protein